ncbi:MAG: hypothetical protein WBN08_01740 [Thiogranum sp.]
MHKESLFTVMIAVLTGTAFAANDQAPMSLGYAQQASGKSVEEVKAADANDDKHIDAAEFGALTVPSKGSRTATSD